MLAELIQKQAEKRLREDMGDEAWEAQSNEARAKLLRVHIFDCWQHLRNIVLKEMSLAQSKRLKEELARAPREIFVVGAHDNRF